MLQCVVHLRLIRVHVTEAADLAGVRCRGYMTQNPAHTAALFKLTEPARRASDLAPMLKSGFLAADGQQHHFRAG